MVRSSIINTISVRCVAKFSINRTVHLSLSVYFIYTSDACTSLSIVELIPRLLLQLRITIRVPILPTWQILHTRMLVGAFHRFPSSITVTIISNSSLQFSVFSLLRVT